MWHSAYFYAAGLLVSLFAFSPSLVAFLRGQASHRWPVTGGRILRSQVRQEQGEATIYIPEVRYQYRVKGQVYESSTIAVVEHHFAWPDRAVAMIAQYGIHQPVNVYYHPQKPAISVLQPGVDRRLAITLAVGVGVCLFFGIHLYASLTAGIAAK
jgi:hypothetical protein